MLLVWIKSTNAFNLDMAKILLSGKGLTLSGKILNSTKFKAFADHKITLSQMTIRLFKTEEFADDNFEIDENGKKFFKRVEKHFTTEPRRTATKS